MRFWTIAVIVLGGLLFLEVLQYANRPTVYRSPFEEGQIVCVLDAEGNEIPFDPEMTKYHPDYAEVCPSDKR